MPNQPTLNLSAHQTHVLSALGIDAWYLQSVSTSAVDTDKQSAVDAVIADVAKSLASPVAQPAISQSPTAVAPLPQPVAASPANTTNSSSKTTPAVALPPPITLERKPQMLPPETNHVDFPQTAAFANDWQDIEARITHLSKQNNTPPFSGQGSRNATWLLVAPPPTRRSLATGELSDEAEKNLLNNLLTALGHPVDDVYYTPLCKHATPYDLDPDATTLSAQLTILASELALLRPKKVLLLGQVTAKAVLQSQALLADLMQQPYQLRYIADGQTQQTELRCLPSLDYFLALPAEKALLWQKVKSWAS